MRCGGPHNDPVWREPHSLHVGGGALSRLAALLPARLAHLGSGPGRAQQQGSIGVRKCAATWLL